MQHDPEFAETILTHSSLLYEALVLNQYVMPNADSRIATLDFMRDVRYGRCWSWRTDEVSYLKEYDFVPKHELKQQLVYCLKEILDDQSSWANQPY